MSTQKNNKVETCEFLLQINYGAEKERELWNCYSFDHGFLYMFRCEVYFWYAPSQHQLM